MEKNRVLIFDEDKIKRRDYKNFFGENYPRYTLEFYADKSSFEKGLRKGIDEVTLIVINGGMSGVYSRKFYERFSRIPKERVVYYSPIESMSWHSFEEKVRKKLGR